jgi:hypothetical protein
MNKGDKIYYGLKELNELIVRDFHHYAAKKSLAVLILVFAAKSLSREM